MYRALALIAGRQYSSANSSLASATYGLDRAAVERALADDVQVLAALADVDGDGDDLGAGLASAIQPMATEVSRPPE